MEAKDRLSNAIVFMLIALLWTALLFVGVWLAFGWLVESFGREVAVVTVFGLAGVLLAVVLWVASSRHTTSIWRSALHYAADTHEMNVTALRSLSSVQREDARAHRITVQGQTAIDVAHYRAQLGTMQDARRLALADLRAEQRTQPAQPSQPAQTWAMDADVNDDGDAGFQWMQ